MISKNTKDFLAKHANHLQLDGEVGVFEISPGCPACRTSFRSMLAAIAMQDRGLIPADPDPTDD